MRKLLFILLCVPFIFSCGKKDKEERNKEDKIIELDKKEQQSDSLNLQVSCKKGLSMKINVRYNYKKKNISSVAITSIERSILELVGSFNSQEEIAAEDTSFKEQIIQLIRERGGKSSLLYNIEVQCIYSKTRILKLLKEKLDQDSLKEYQHLTEIYTRRQVEAYKIEDEEERRKELLDIEEYFEKVKERIQIGNEIKRKKLNNINAYYKSPKE